MTLGLTALLALLSTWQMLGIADRLGVNVAASKTWLALISLPGLLFFSALAASLLTLLPHWQGWIENPVSLPRLENRLRWLAAPFLAACLSAYPVLLAQPTLSNLISKAEFVRLLMFWLLALAGSGALRVLWKKIEWPAALALVLLLQASAHLIFCYITGITAYPFALGWSETSRYYYPSLFLAQKIYGQPFSWPILHPSLHLLLIPPYLWNAPLWFHRAWQITIRFILVGGIAPALLTRLNIPSRPARLAAGSWIFLTLFDLPLYLHLALPVILILWGFSVKDARRTWLVLILASIWAGISRINWYPVPGMLAAALYLLETPMQGKTWRYLLKPLAWVISGSVTAFLSMRIYIAFSGIPQAGDFYTSLGSALLWYRLWPNATYPPGVLPGILLYSLPMWLALIVVFLRRDIHPLRVGLLLAGLATLFAGGIVVSMKIGGGGDLHNLDAYAVALIVVGTTLFFGRYAPETVAGQGRDSGEIRPPLNFHWMLVALIVLVPVWLGQRPSSAFVSYDRAAGQAAITELQRRVDAVNAAGGEILFITQRHLIAMNMLHSVKLIPEYEREELMEMAMADNQVYLDEFKAEIRARRFSAIVVDPLAVNLLGSDYSMGEENNAWVRYVAKPVLCNYRADQTFAGDHIVIYVPQEAPQCP